MPKPVTINDIIKGLKTLGLTKGDKVMVHSALSSFGNVKGSDDTVIDALLAVAGPTGTVLMPTFGSSTPVFDPRKSKTNLGDSAWYYDEGWATEASYNPDLHRVGQLNAVPSWTNPYLDGDEDWTDVQFGARTNQAPPADNYYYVAAGENSPGWVDTGVDRVSGWHQLKMQLLNSDGKIHFSIDGIEVGASYRNDYADLLGIGLMIQFTSPLSSWTNNKPWTIWDDFEYGSAVPEPATMVLLALGGVLLRRKK